MLQVLKVIINTFQVNYEVVFGLYDVEFQPF